MQSGDCPASCPEGVAVVVSLREKIADTFGSLSLAAATGFGEREPSKEWQDYYRRQEQYARHRATRKELREVARQFDKTRPPGW